MFFSCPYDNVNPVTNIIIVWENGCYLQAQRFVSVFGAPELWEISLFLIPGGSNSESNIPGISMADP